MAENWVHTGAYTEDSAYLACKMSYKSGRQHADCSGMDFHLIAVAERGKYVQVQWA